MTSSASNDRERELSVLLEISRVLASNTNLRSLVAAVLEQLRFVIDYTGAAVVTFADGGIEVVESVGPDGREAEMVGLFIKIDDETWDGFRQVRSGQTISIPNVMADEPMGQGFRRTFADYIDWDSMSYIRSWMAVPLVLEDRVVGMLSLSHKQPGYFTQHHLEMASLVARQAAVAAENARLFERTQRQTRELSALLEISGALSSTLELQPLLELMLDRLKEVVPYDGAAVMLGEKGVMRQLATRRPHTDGVSDEPDTSPRETRAENFSVMWERIRVGDYVIIDDVWDDTVEGREYRNQWGGDLRGTRVEYVHSFLNVSLVVRGEMIGVVSLGHSTPGFFQEEHARVARAFADQAALAIENARLFEESQRAERETSAMLEVAIALSSTIETRPLMELLLDMLANFVDYAGASVSLLRDDVLVQVALRRPRGPDVLPEDLGMLTPVEAFGRDRLMREQALIIDDVRAETPDAKAFRVEHGDDLTVSRVAYMRSLLAFPLIARNDIVGVISMSHEEVGYFNESHVELLRPIASQAAVVLENAVLFEQSESRTRELAALLEVSKAVVSTLDLDVLMGVILDRLTDIIEHTGSAFVMVDGDSLVIRDSRTFGHRSAGEVGIRIKLSRSYAVWDAVKAGGVIVADLLSDEHAAVAIRDVLGSVGAMDVPPVHQIRSWMAVPVVIKDEAVGMITASSADVDRFNRKDMALVRAFADQAALAIENARLFEETQRRSRETEALLRSDEQLFRSLNPDDVFQALADIAVDLLGADKSLLWIHDPAVGHMRTRASRNFSPESVEAMRQAEPFKQALHPGEIFVEENLAANVHPLWRSILEDEDIRRYAEISFVSPSGDAIGSFALGYTSDHHLTDDEQRMLFALGERASMAIGNADLHERAGQLTALEERQRLARELHDSVSQALYGIALGARTARALVDRDPASITEPLDYVLSLAEAGLAEMRALIFELRPESLESEGIVAALDKQIAAMSARHQLQINSDLCDEPDTTLERKETLYRISQEALHNIVKHARASEVHVTLASAKGDISLKIADNGLGFDPDRDFPGHLGLKSMRERAQKVGGNLRIESEAGRGTAITVSFAK